MKHPDLCYVFIPSSNELGIVKWAESGYYKTSFGAGYSWEDAYELNEEMFKMSKVETEAMSICSMANIPETDEAWQKHYKMIIDDTVNATL